jgi:hypothetical protein
MGRFSTTLRSGLIVALGAALIFMPLPLGLSSAAAVTGVAVGTLAIALGLAGTAPDGRGTLPLSAQAVYDRGLALGLLVAAVVFGLNGQDPALAFFGAAGVAALTVALGTGYRERPVYRTSPNR